MDYEEKLRLAKEALDSGSYDKETIEYIFPELAESKDEKIRKELLNAFKEATDSLYMVLTPSKREAFIAWLEKQNDKDKLIKELGEYKVKYTQEVLEKHISMSNKDDKRLRNTTIAFLKDFAEQGYENAVECIDWLEKQGEQETLCDLVLVPEWMNVLLRTLKNI